MTTTPSRPCPAAGCAAASRDLPIGRCPARSCRCCRCGRGCGQPDTGRGPRRGTPRTGAGHATPGTPISPWRRSSGSGNRSGRSSGPSCSATGSSAGGHSVRVWHGAHCSPMPARAGGSRTTQRSHSSGCSRAGWFAVHSHRGSGLPTRGPHCPYAAPLHGAPSAARSAARDAPQRAVDAVLVLDKRRTSCLCASGIRRSVCGPSGSGGARSLRCRSRRGSVQPNGLCCWVASEGLLLGRRVDRTAGRARRRTDVVSRPESIRPI